MLNSILISGFLLLSGPNADFSAIWQKIEGKWSYVGKVKEKTQILLSPKGEVIDIQPLH